ncbi:hypothetical protein [Blautia obeum]|uniref:hypothetical protein n=1 Tax=Blautia obeum TaxID=40520 RepID=UPI0039840846
MKNILKVRMLGGFTLEYKGKELVLDRNNVSKYNGPYSVDTPNRQLGHFLR